MTKDIKMKYKQAKITPAEAAARNLRGLYEQYGYQKFKMSKFEEYGLYASNMDFLSGDKVLTFTDLDGRLMALKPDVTLSIIKNSTADMQSSEKLYYTENVYREDREGNNFVEIEQMGLEYLGDVDDYGITEVIALAVKTLQSIDQEYILEISHMSFVTELLDDLTKECGIERRDYVHLLNLIRRKNVPGIAKVAESLGIPEEKIERLKAVPTLFGPVNETLKRAGKYVINDEMSEGLDQLERVAKGLRAMNASKNVQIDLSLVNDTNYYNGIIFKGYFRELARHVLAGGQYDKAMAKFGRNTGAIGFGLYLNELSQLAVEKDKYDVDALMLYGAKEPLENVAKAITGLRKQGLSARAERARPKGLRCGKVYRLKDGVLTERKTNA